MKFIKYGKNTTPMIKKCGGDWMLGASNLLKKQVVIFNIDDQRYALPLDVVLSVERIVEVTKIPDNTEYISGIIDVHGTVMAVIDFRKRLNLRIRPVLLSDQLIIIHCHERPFALIVDSVSGVSDIDSHDITPIEEIISTNSFLIGIGKAKGSLILLNNPNELFTYNDLDNISKIQSVVLP